MAEKLRVLQKPATSRNWIAYLCEALVTSGIMPTWEAATYLTENLFGEKPNPRLLGPAQPYQVASEFLQRLYHPIVEAASREVNLPTSCSVHVFTDISLTGNSAILIVLFRGGDREQLVMLDGAKTWDLVFPDADSFNGWAETRYRQVVEALSRSIAGGPTPLLTAPAI